MISVCKQSPGSTQPGHPSVSSGLRATEWRPRLADWALICLRAAPRVQLFASAAIDGCIMRCDRPIMPIICHIRDCKALLGSSLTAVSSAIATSTRSLLYGPGRVLKRYDGCSSCSSCCYPFRKMPKALLIRNGKLRNFAYTLMISFSTDLPS